MAELGPLDDLQRARLVRLRAEIEFARRRGGDAPKLLLDAAERLTALDAGLARETFLEALAAAIFAGRLGGQRGLLDAAEAARGAPPGPASPQPIDLLLDGLARRFTEGYQAGVPALRRAVEAFRRPPQDEDDTMRWLWPAYPIAQETAAHDLWDYQAWRELAARAVRLARDTGALAVLPVALVYQAGVHLHAGEFATASALVEEADEITAATGYAPVRYASLVLVGWRGDEAQALRRIQADVADATARGEGRVLGMAGYVTAVLYNGLGRYQAALAGANQACEHDDLGFHGWSLAELVEAGVRSGAPDQANAALRQLDGRTRASGTDWALGILARARALLCGGGAAEPLYREAIERLGRTGVAIQLARAHLVYGEWLRRENRRVDARHQLRTAHEMLSRFGADAFADRAARELVATGETIRKHRISTSELLTAQEAQIAQLAGEGGTNPEIASQLFISPRTVEYHLAKVFTKLGISSRRELRGALHARQHAALPA